MGFSTATEQESFLRDAPDFERMLIESGIRLVKLWLDISREEQKARLDARRTDPLKQLKVSDLDAVAQERWDDYSAARDRMLSRTHTALSPWHCIRADHKKPARIAALAHVVARIAPDAIAHEQDLPDPKILFPFEESAITDGRLAC